MTQITLPDMTIASGETTSTAIGPLYLDFLQELLLHTPATFDGTISVEVSDRDPEHAVAADWRNLVEDGAELTVAADQAVPIENIGFRGIRLVSSIAETAERVVKATGDDGNP